MMHIVLVVFFFTVDFILHEIMQQWAIKTLIVYTVVQQSFIPPTRTSYSWVAPLIFISIQDIFAFERCGLSLGYLVPLLCLLRLTTKLISIKWPLIPLAFALSAYLCDTMLLNYLIFGITLANFSNLALIAFLGLFFSQLVSKQKNSYL